MAGGLGEEIWHLGLALGLGLLIGLERGWSQREEAEGQRVAGLRTFGVIGLAGGMIGLLAERTDWLVLAAAFPSFVVLLVFAFSRGQDPEGRHGATTLFAALATFVIAIAAVVFDPSLAVAAGVVLTILLGLKRPLHHALEKLRQDELLAVLELLLISAVILPVLPDRAFGPFEALNPYRIWLMVVLVAGVSFVGYVAIRLFGARRGPLLTGLFGGLVSSTAVTLALSRLARQPGADPSALAAGAAIASSIMFWRSLLIVFIVNPALAGELALPLLAAGAIGGVVSLAVAGFDRNAPTEFAPGNPMHLLQAVEFGLFLGLIGFLAAALRDWLGDTGVYVLAPIAGLADVDAISLSLASMSMGDLAANVAASGVLLAALVNTFVKQGIALVLAPRAMAWRMALPLAAALLTGAALRVFLPVALF
ncbi:MAG: DUF4010 domain-containing protein [Rhodospirillales bacterium]